MTLLFVYLNNFLRVWDNYSYSLRRWLFSKELFHDYLSDLLVLMLFCGVYFYNCATKDASFSAADCREDIGRV